jgi:stalled ribosome rescue protein Dom34
LLGVIVAFQPGADGESRKCLECDAPAKFIKRSLMSGQEKYESDKERKEAEQMAAEKRKLAEEHAKKIPDIEQNAKFLQGNGENARAFADKIRSL